MKLTTLPRFERGLLDPFRNSEMKSSSRRTTGEDRSLLRVNEDRSQAFNNEIDYITTFRKRSIRPLSKLRNEVKFAANDWRGPEFTASK